MEEESDFSMLSEVIIYTASSLLLNRVERSTFSAGVFKCQSNKLAKQVDSTHKHACHNLIWQIGADSGPSQLDCTPILNSPWKEEVLSISTMHYSDDLWGTLA